ncbi:nitrophenyl compound nitroreductase subunit ArsF family protein [uncultured Lutibacter sp.]|uniref:nitrophenyl compound nitroreductase subunit ArsF family protein n=1 Tax=uncultured Lutibacter sp. TaxID=437739 RepID=UPI002624E660|nr:nitrophenyl compound nitroreductase subunit ArsF family protein [uncultured Lutibacter sp.]
MKSLKTLPILIVSLFLFSCNGKAQTEKSINKKIANKIEVIDFHSTHRCMTCNAIEASTKYTLDTYFSEELKNESITLLIVNVDDEKNYKLAEKFEATGTALFLNVIIDGKETQIDLTEFAFMNGNDQEKFSKELKVTLETELKKV